MIWIVSIDDVDKFEQKEMKEIRPIKNTWYDWIINSEPVRKSVGGFKDKIISLFKTNTPKQTVHGRGKKLSTPKTQNIRNLFILKKKKEEVNDRIIRDIQKLFKTQKEKKTKKEIRRKKRN